MDNASTECTFYYAFLQNMTNDNTSGSFRRKTTPFSVVSNHALRNENLSLKEKGLYAMIASFLTIPDFVLYKQTLINNCEDGKKGFQTAWDSLKKAGYLIQYKTRVGNRYAYEYELLDEPLQTNEPIFEHTHFEDLQNGIHLIDTELNNEEEYKELSCESFEDAVVIEFKKLTKPKIKAKVNENYKVDIINDRFELLSQKEELKVFKNIVRIATNVLVAKRDYTFKASGEIYSYGYLVERLLNPSFGDITYTIERFIKNKDNVAHPETYLLKTLITAKENRDLIQ